MSHKEHLRELVVKLHEEGLSCLDVALKAQVSTNTARKWLKEYGLEPRQLKKHTRPKERTGRFAHLK